MTATMCMLRPASLRWQCEDCHRGVLPLSCPPSHRGLSHPRPLSPHGSCPSQSDRPQGGLTLSPPCPMPEPLSQVDDQKFCESVYRRLHEITEPRAGPQPPTPDGGGVSPQHQMLGSPQKQPPGRQNPRDRLGAPMHPQQRTGLPTTAACARLNGSMPQACLHSQ